MREQQEEYVGRETEYRRIWEARISQRQSALVAASQWDACEDDTFRPSPKGEVVVVGLDIGVKKDTLAVVARSYNSDTRKLELIEHRILNPSDFGVLGGIIEAAKEYILDIKRRHQLLGVFYDPTQGYLLAHDLNKHRVDTYEVKQGSSREQIDEQYRQLIVERRLRNHAHALDLRHHVLNADVRYTRDGTVRIEKRMGSAMPNDAAIADAMACAGCLRMEEQFRRARHVPNAAAQKPRNWFKRAYSGRGASA